MKTRKFPTWQSLLQSDVESATGYTCDYCGKSYASALSALCCEDKHTPSESLEDKEEETVNDPKALYEKALRLWGADAQITMAFEEFGELIQALAKYQNNRKDRATLRENLIEEIVDVEIMLGQIKVYLSIKDSDTEDAIAACRNAKLCRLHNRLYPQG